MLMVVFGAGASYGSRRERGPRELPGIREPERPPLTGGLLAAKHSGFAAKYPSSRPAIVALQRALSKDQRDDWQLFKLHGSVGWSRILKGWGGVDSDNANAVIAASGNADFDGGDLRPLPCSRAVNGEIAVAVPGITVPTTLKRNFQCPQEHVEKFSEAVAGIDRLLTIGWRAAEPHVIAHNNLGLAAQRSPDPKAFNGGFTGLLEADHLEQWLSLPSPGYPR